MIGKLYHHRYLFFLQQTSFLQSILKCFVAFCRAKEKNGALTPLIPGNGPNSNPLRLIKGLFFDGKNVSLRLLGSSYFSVPSLNRPQHMTIHTLRQQRMILNDYGTPLLAGLCNVTYHEPVCQRLILEINMLTNEQFEKILSTLN